LMCLEKCIKRAFPLRPPPKHFAVSVLLINIDSKLMRCSMTKGKRDMCR
jgi:hypothetical protein